MSKTIIATRLCAPDVGGYPDKIRIVDDSNGMVLFEKTRFSTNPNPFKPITCEPWQKVYAQLAPGEYSFTCAISPKHGKCLTLNDGWNCATTFPDPNNDGKMFAREVEIHCGYSAAWRGSMCCQTVPPSLWGGFINHFELGETGIYELIDEQNEDEPIENA